MKQYTPLQQQESFTIRTYEIDHHKRATVPALVRLMHEAAMQNVIRLKLSVWDLEPQHLTWVLMRKAMRFERLPLLGERITVLTYPAGFERLFTYRDYRVFDNAGRQIAASSSTWLLMDTRSRRMSPIPNNIRALNDQMPASADCLPRPGNKIPRPDRLEKHRRYIVNFFDLDFNQHLNNTLYMKWMLEALPDEVLIQQHLQTLNIQYRNECHWQEEVIAETRRIDAHTFLHRLKLEKDGKELALARTVWKD